VHSFYLLRDFHGGADGRVCLACHIEIAAGVKKGRLAVIKFISGELTMVTEEVSRWHKLGITSVNYTIISKRHAIVMPFEFHYNLVKVESTVNGGLQITYLFETVYTIVVNQKPQDVLTNSIGNCAKNKLIHTDIEWRHVAVFPKPPTRSLMPFGHLSTRTHNFIELSGMKNSVSKDDATLQMLESNERLLDQLS
jgi:hypothetical protein